MAAPSSSGWMSSHHFFFFSGQDKAGEGEGSVREQQWRRSSPPGAGPEEGDGPGGGQVQGHRPEQQATHASRQLGHHQVGRTVLFFPSFPHRYLYN